MVTGLGFTWVVVWLLATWFVKADIYNHSSFGPWKSQEDEARRDSAGRAEYKRAAGIARKEIPLAVIVMAIGVLIALV